MSDAERLARQAVSLVGKERLYERAVVSEAWVIELQTRLSVAERERDEAIKSLSDEEKAYCRQRDLRIAAETQLVECLTVLGEVKPYLWNGLGEPPRIWESVTQLLALAAMSHVGVAS